MCSTNVKQERAHLLVTMVWHCMKEVSEGHKDNHGTFTETCVFAFMHVRLVPREVSKEGEKFSHTHTSVRRDACESITMHVASIVATFVLAL